MKFAPTPSKDEIARTLALMGVGVLNPGWGKRRLKRFKVVDGKKYQLHATRGWKVA